jgi:hypothetical protein
MAKPHRWGNANTAGANSAVQVDVVIRTRCQVSLRHEITALQINSRLKPFLAASSQSDRWNEADYANMRWLQQGMAAGTAEISFAARLAKGDTERGALKLRRSTTGRGAATSGRTKVGGNFTTRHRGFAHGRSGRLRR